MNKTSTIVALSTPPGQGGIAVVRLSGPQSGAAIEALTGKSPAEPRRAVLRSLYDDAGALLDKGLVLFFSAPASATGEDMAEFHVHGGPAVVAGVLESLTGLSGIDLAEPGDFTRRAFEAGRLDLTAVEGLADLIAADTKAQHRQAVRQMNGALAHLCDGWRDQLVKALAYLEAEIDFPDEDLPEALSAEVVSPLMAVVEDMERTLNRVGGERIREGVQVAIIGPPNVGKSSLLNALARREAAIVADESGTTRDVIEVALDLGGMPVVLFDTAGLREVEEGVEAEGVRRARVRADQADIRLIMVSVETSVEDARDVLALRRSGDVVVVNKQDLGRHNTIEGAYPLSVLTSQGLEMLEEVLVQAVTELAGEGEGTVVTRLRHREALGAAHRACARALEVLSSGGSAKVELAAEDVRLGVRALGRLVGRVDVDDILDVIFRDFCIGK
ncbi:MAG: tRNA uridine-5-carboxymethylaminomethyl(34) synthesis GTPase MnmE [Parvularculales bacterium]